MKRIIALFLILSLVIIPPSTRAANEVFVGINNIMLPLTDSMPVYTSGAWYVDYRDFTRGDLNVHISYNKELGTAVLYNWDTTLVFNVGKGTGYKNGGTQYNQRSFFKNGTVYVPAAFVCEQFGITFSYISEVSTIRFKTTSSMSDTMFTYIAKNRIPDLVAAYNKSKAPPSDSTKNPDNPSSESTDSEASSDDFSKNTVYVTFNVQNGEKLNEIYSLLSNNNISATIFLSKSAMTDDNLIRRLCSGRHTIGIYAASVTEANAANDTLFAITKKKTRLLRSDKKITDAEANGYRQWGFNTDARTRNATQTNKLLDSQKNSIILFSDSATSINRLKSILPHITKQKYTVRTIELMTTPIAP